MSQRITLARIAADAGVSPPTVSKVLNGRDDVAPATRARVQAVLDALDYRAPGRPRTRGRERTLVDFVCDGLAGAYAVEVLRGVVDRAAEEGVDVVVSQEQHAPRPDRDPVQWARQIRDEGRAGLIMVTSHADRAILRAFRDHGVPVVLIDPMTPFDSDVTRVGATNWSGGRTATEHLLAAGHRRIAHIGGPVHAECSVARLNGYFAALDAAGVPRDPELVVTGSFAPDNGVAALRALLALDAPPTAVFAANESIAVGVYEEAARHGLRIPDDLSVVGFDGTHLSAHALPPMTTVAQPLHEMGGMALRLLLRQAAQDAPEPQHLELATRLIERDSVAAPR